MLTAAQRAAARRYADKVAEHLGQGHTLVDEETDGAVRLALGLQMLVMTFGGWQNEKRIRITGAYPDEHRHVLWSIRHVTITCAISRGPRAVAAEIRRRLLPDYLPRLDQALAAIAAHLEDLDRQRATAEAVAAALPERRRAYSSGSDEAVTLYGGGEGIDAHFRITTGSLTEITIKVRTGEDATRIAQLITRLDREAAPPQERGDQETGGQGTSGLH